MYVAFSCVLTGLSDCRLLITSQLKSAPNKMQSHCAFQVATANCSASEEVILSWEDNVSELKTATEKSMSFLINFETISNFIFESTGISVTSFRKFIS